MGANYLESLIRGVINLEYAETYQEIVEAFNGILSDATYLARDKFGQLADRQVGKLKNDMHDLRVQAQGGQNEQSS